MPPARHAVKTLASLDLFPGTPAHGVKVTQARSGTYLAKLGLEIVGTPGKLSPSGHRTPFELAADGVLRGDERALRLFTDYCEAFRGAKMLTWSRNATSSIRHRDIRQSQRNEKDNGNEVVGVLTRDRWKAIRARPLAVLAILESAERFMPSSSEGFPPECRLLTKADLTGAAAARAPTPSVELGQLGAKSHQVRGYVKVMGDLKVRGP